ncbi:MAG: hypothetical protein KDD70_16325, partial [Bdellovibrionales bacterium]|nr:hypothetical protein [Bdellovibrionales bacterium]
MSIRRLFFFALVASVIHLAPFFSYSTHSAFAAGDKEEEEEEEREVQLGVIAGEQRGGFEGLTSGSSSTVSDSITGELPPVTGSVSKVGQNKMLAKLTNNHEENKYSLNFQIHQLDKWGK